uniref:Uncharacterized protein n=1 Tax=Faecalibaculum rodentium TaxID=1702221 RepID=A0A140DT30_9FIRM|nr:hypothetical protein AALO17_06730 [Faecalibaculum rodentium]
MDASAYFPTEASLVLLHSRQTVRPARVRGPEAGSQYV